MDKLSLLRTALVYHGSLNFKMNPLPIKLAGHFKHLIKVLFMLLASMESKHYIHSFIYSGYFYSTSSSPLLPRGARDTAWILCPSFNPKRHRQLRVKDLPKVPTWQLERDSNPRPFGRKAPNLPMSHYASLHVLILFYQGLKGPCRLTSAHTYQVFDFPLEQPTTTYSAYCCI